MTGYSLPGKAFVELAVNKAPAPIPNFSKCLRDNSHVLGASKVAAELQFEFKSVGQTNDLLDCVQHFIHAHCIILTYHLKPMLRKGI